MAKEWLGDQRCEFGDLHDAGDYDWPIMGRSFKVVVSNSAGSITPSNAATLTVKPGPSFAQHHRPARKSDRNGGADGHVFRGGLWYSAVESPVARERCANQRREFRELYDSGDGDGGQRLDF